MEYDSLVDYLTREALQECARRDITIQRPLMKFMLQWLLNSRKKDLKDADEEITTQIYQSIYDQIIANGPVIRMFRLTYYVNNSTTDYDKVQEKYATINKEKLIPLLESICTFAGNSKAEIEELYTKIAVYIVAANKMFSTKKPQMMAEAKCALHSILTTQDLFDFVTRKKHYRQDYLDRLGKIMCGILLFNKHMGYGGMDIRDVVADIQVAYKNTLESVWFNISRGNHLITLGLKAVARTVTLNLVDRKLMYTLPANISLEDLELFNKFNYLHMQHEIYLHKLKEPLDKLKNLIEQNKGQLKEVLFELQDIVKFRLAIPSELVFPHFTKLFEIRNQILMQLYYLVDINKINDEMAAIVTTEYQFEEMASRISVTEPVETLEVNVEHFVNTEEEQSISRIHTFKDSKPISPMRKFCALTIAVSNGILVHSEIVFGVLPFQNQFMAFKRKDYGAFAEKHYTSLVKKFHRTALRNPEICLLFKISTESTPLAIDSKITLKSNLAIGKKKTFDTGLQTENCLPPPTLESIVSYSWNIWELRKRAIHLANLRKCHTHSTQTSITYGAKEAAIQTYDSVPG